MKVAWFPGPIGGITWRSVGKRFNTLRPRQNGRHFPDDIFKWIFLNENVWLSINISLKFVPRGPINNIPTLVQVMAWRRPGDKPLSESMTVRLPTHICVTRLQWVNVCWLVLTTCNLLHYSRKFFDWSAVNFLLELSCHEAKWTFLELIFSKLTSDVFMRMCVCLLRYSKLVVLHDSFVAFQYTLMLDSYCLCIIFIFSITAI